ncbi:MAG: hypothetical protein ACTSUN_00835 [Promethearchaeota archaeon]
MGKKENPKIYICSECGYEFPLELSKLIENNIQVYCEQCGAPFNLKGKTFRELPRGYWEEEGGEERIKRKEGESLDKVIQVLNNISFIPIIIFSIIAILSSVQLILTQPEQWLLLFLSRITVGVTGLLIFYHDAQFIYPRVKNKSYTGITTDAFILGILGCVIYGTGVIILIKGVFILIKVVSDKEVRKKGLYDFGLRLKNSLNNISAKGGFLIIFLGWYDLFSNTLRISEKTLITLFLAYLSLTIISLVILILDWSLLSKIRKKNKFYLIDAFGLMVMGIFACAFYGSGILILLKAAVIFGLSFGTPPPLPEESKIPAVSPPPKEAMVLEIEYRRREIEKPVVKEQPAKPITGKEPLLPKDISPIIPSQKETIKETKIEQKEIRRELDYQLKLHESLLPIKSEKDKNLIKKYFTKIFTVVSKDIRKRINELDISKKEKKELLRELAFLTREQQIKYLEELSNLYREIPGKLINRIKKLPNLKPEYYKQIIEQIKYMDEEEQINFINYLEKKAY